MRLAALLLLTIPIVLGGSIDEPDGPSTVLNFADVAGRHFHNLWVERDFGSASRAPLVLYVELLGDEREADLSRGVSWLRTELHVVVVERPGGLPVFLTSQDLVGSRGNDALGATIPTGIAVEARDASLQDCAFAHEIGHALGLKHAAGSKSDIMAPRCDRGKIEWATASPAAKDHVARLESMTAYGLGGATVWAER